MVEYGPVLPLDRAIFSIFDVEVPIKGNSNAIILYE